MKATSSMSKLFVMFALVFFSLNLAMPVVMSLLGNQESKYLDFSVYAQEDEEGEEVAAEEEDDKAYLYDIGAAKDIMEGWKEKEKTGEFFQFPYFGNRKGTWMIGQLHILFASFILGCPMFVILMEIMGAERTPSVKRATAVGSMFTAAFVGIIMGAVAEVILGIHGAEHGGLYAGAIAAIVTAVMAINGMITKEDGIVKSFGAGAVVGAIIGFMSTHSMGGAIFGIIAGGIGGIVSPAMINAEPDAKFERLAHEVAKVIGMCYSFTALTGGFFFLVLVVLYPDFISFLLRGFPMLTSIIYPLLFIIETILMYSYVYSWDPLDAQGKKGTHLALGLTLNVVGMTLLLAMNSTASFMNAPTKPLNELATMGEMAWFTNYAWMPLNFHRMVGNVTFGGYMVGLISAYMFLWSDKQEDKEFYDWQGYMGNIIGVAAMVPLMAMGYVFIRELYMYDAAIGMYIMSDRLSMFMITQALLILCLFLASNLYMWVSMKRIEGAERFFPYMKVFFGLLIVCAAVWFTPRRYYATMMPEGPLADLSKAELAKLELPAHVTFLGVMISKNSASFALGIITMINYVFYTIAGKTGKTAWGKVNPLSQYILIFIAFTDIWLMSWMGVIREQARKNWHIYKVFKDVSADKYTLPLADAGQFVTMIVWIFFALMTFIIWLSLRYQKSVAKAGH